MYSCDIVKSLLELNDLAGLKTANADLLKQLKVIDTRALGSEELLGANKLLAAPTRRYREILEQRFIYRIMFGNKRRSAQR